MQNDILRACCWQAFWCNSFSPSSLSRLWYCRYFSGWGIGTACMMVLSHGTSYPYVRQLSVAIDDVVSATHIINCSVREGSVAEPFMFPNYTARTGRVLQQWNYEISWRYSVVSCVELILQVSTSTPWRLHPRRESVDRLLLYDAKTEVLICFAIYEEFNIDSHLPCWWLSSWYCFRSTKP